MANASARDPWSCSRSAETRARSPPKRAECPSPLGVGAVRRPAGTSRAGRDRVRLACGRFASIGAAAGGRRRTHPTRSPHGGRRMARQWQRRGPGTGAREGQQSKKTRYERRTRERQGAREMARVTVRHACLSLTFRGNTGAVDSPVVATCQCLPA